MATTHPGHQRPRLPRTWRSVCQQPPRLSSSRWISTTGTSNHALVMAVLAMPEKHLELRQRTSDKMRRVFPEDGARPDGDHLDAERSDGQHHSSPSTGVGATRAARTRATVTASTRTDRDECARGHASLHRHCPPRRGEGAGSWCSLRWSRRGCQGCADPAAESAAVGSSTRVTWSVA